MPADRLAVRQAHDNNWVLKYLYDTAPDGQLDAWTGYWVKVVVECDLIIPNTPLPQPQMSG